MLVSFRGQLLNGRKISQNMVEISSREAFQGSRKVETFQGDTLYVKNVWLDDLDALYYIKNKAIYRGEEYEAFIKGDQVRLVASGQYKESLKDFKEVSTNVYEKEVLRKDVEKIIEERFNYFTQTTQRMELA